MQRRQPSEQRAEGGIGPDTSPRYGSEGNRAAHSGGGRVRRAVVDADPREPFARLAAHPLERGGDHGIGPALALAGLAAGGRVEPIVLIKPAFRPNR